MRKLLLVMFSVICLAWFAFTIYCATNEVNDGFTLAANLNGEIYKLEEDWHPIGTETYTTKVWLEYMELDETIIPGKPNRNVIRYKNDEDDLFISYDSVIDRVYNLHKVSHELPVIYSDQVEKVVLTYTETPSGSIVLQGEVMNAYLDWLRDYFEGSKPGTADCVPNKSISGINIFFIDNFPAYYDSNEIIVGTTSGKLGVEQLRGLKNGECVFLPEIVQDYILK